jgi:ABC-2 type transport system permease protein
MFWPIFRFELGFQLRRPSTYLYFGILFLLAFFFIASDVVEIGGGVGRVMRNAPFTIAQTMLILTALGQVITSALVGTAILRDYEMKSHELLFTTSISKIGYLGGRFAGAFVVMVLVYSAIPLGTVIATFMPWVSPEKLAAFHAWHYVSPFFILLLPNLVFICALFFAAGVLTRNPFAIYTLGIFLLVADTLAGELRKNVDSFRVTALSDPLGFSTFEVMTRYWTVVEKNTLTVPLSGYMLLNRLMLLGVSVLLLGATYAMFRFDAMPRALWRRRTALPRAARTDASATAPSVQLPVTHQSWDRAARLREILSQVRFSFMGIVRDIPFLAITTVGIVNVFMSTWYADSWYDSKLYPVTYSMAETISQSFSLFFIILITVYAGELVWRERTIKADQIVDALPVRSSLAITGRLLGLVGALAVLLGVCALTAMLVQAVKGYTNFEVGLYLRFLYLAELPSLIQLTLLAFFVHTIINNKYVGHFVMLVIFLALPLAVNLGWEHRLLQFGRTPGFRYSDMNGFGPYVGRLSLYTGYWMAFGLLLAVVATVFWVRGTETTARFRFATAASRLSRRVLIAGATFAGLTLLLGGAVYYNSDVLNRYDTKKERREVRASYERRFRRFRTLVQPRITDVSVRADLVPERRAFALSGTYTIVNTRARPVDTLYVSLSTLYQLAPNVTLDSMHLSRPMTLLPVSDSASGVLLYRLATPLAPGDTATLGFGFHYAARGFPNGDPNNDIAGNGSFINSNYAPSLGYSENAELTDDDERKKAKLPPRERMHAITDTAAYQNNEFSTDADWVTFDAVVSTAPDQIAIAPGYLQKEWMEGGRRLFHYRTETRIANFFSFLSARYAVRKDRWAGANGSPPVAIEIYYQPGHEYNLDRMVSSVKKSLDYYTANFSPYQFRQVRILEFPRYATFAQSFPNTIPFSEGIGFITRVGTKDEDIDMPFFVTAHEVAHQWWGHQVIGANVQGAAIMVESLAEYSALMVMQKEYGQASSQKFLRYELDRYLRGRSNERKREQPLMLTEQQAYIHYNKGSLVFYALQDYIGEAKMNGALRSFLLKHQYPTAPYPTSLDLIRELRAVTPDSLQPVITDLFETITLFDNKADSVTAAKRADGRYDVHVFVSARKLRADSVGAEHEIPVADWVDVGVFAVPEKGRKMGRPLYLQKRRITTPHAVFDLVVDALPKNAGIDPYNKLIDREPKDNLRDATMK